MLCFDKIQYLSKKHPACIRYRWGLRGKNAKPVGYSNHSRLSDPENTVQNSPQFFSSEPSEQSLSVSQTQSLGIHMWLSQVKEEDGQVDVGLVGQFCSSLPSKQSLCWSQRHWLGMHCPPRAQVKAKGEQELSANSHKGVKGQDNVGFDTFVRPILFLQKPSPHLYTK